MTRKKKDRQGREQSGRDRRHRRDELTDLDPYLGCPSDARLGLDPLGVGWLRRGQSFDTGPVPEAFPAALLEFCLDKHTVCARPGSMPCSLCGERPQPIELDGETAQFGLAEIRVLGKEDIFAAPTLVHHYVTVHHYRPPDVFVQAVLHGPPPGSPEHRALVRTLNGA